MNNFREVNDDILKEWLDFREEDLLRYVTEEDRKYNIYFDEAYARGILLQELDLAKVDVNMFGAVNNQLVNDGCGLFKGRLILPYEHLSRFQNDIID